jgi:hypothetical protein
MSRKMYRQVSVLPEHAPGDLSRFRAGTAL